jgi:hypothetical protein
MNMLWLLRLRRLLQHPPSKQRVMLVIVVLVVCAALVGVEKIWGWPAGLTVNKVRR